MSDKSRQVISDFLKYVYELLLFLLKFYGFIGAVASIRQGFLLNLLIYFWKTQRVLTVFPLDRLQLN